MDHRVGRELQCFVEHGDGIVMLPQADQPASLALERTQPGGVVGRQIEAQEVLARIERLFEGASGERPLSGGQKGRR
jgi:hypothetical protein